MDELEIVQKISKIKFWHQKIRLTENIVTPGLQDTFAMLEHLNLPIDLNGQRVLDIGARDGFFSFECEKRGATVVALDYTNPNNTGFNVCKEILKSEVTYFTENIYNLNKLDLQKFDIILFLGVIYHLRHPTLVLDLIYENLKLGGKLFVESHIIDEGLVQNGKWSKLNDLNPNLDQIALAQFYSPGELGNDPTNYWAPNFQALKQIIQNSGFQIEYEKKLGFRGIVSGKKIAIDNNHPKLMDTAREFLIHDMNNPLKIIKNGSIQF